MDLKWIILLPLFGALLNGVILRSKNAVLSGSIATLAALGAFLISCTVPGRIPEGASLVELAATWFHVGRLKVDFLLEATPVTGIMLLVVTGIGSLIHLYSIGYMSHDKSPWRFFAYLNLFLAAMLTLVLSGDLVGVFTGWEGVGLCSYLLIGYWYTDDKNAAAGMKAFITNRVGDLGFIFALLMLVSHVGSTQIREIIAAFNGGNTALPLGLAAAVAGGLFWASTGKSAQIPLYIWLPDAMAGPTPVSALIHAATMVTSGIFLTVRLWPIFAGQEEVLHVMMWGGIATAWLAALIALTQRDIKKVLAYSTVSQLGFMFVALGCGSPTAALFHVVTHACFKALLFLGAGSVIHGMHEKQDLFDMGNLRKHMPVTHILFLIATLAIIGFPMTSGFFSKDMILAKAFEVGPLYFVLMLSAALMTAFYMFRLYALAFWGEARTKEASHAHESPAVMTLPLAVLGVLSLVVGWMETPETIGGIHKLEHWVEAGWYGWKAVAEHGAEMSHGTELGLMALTTVLSLSVAWFSFKKFGGKVSVPGTDFFTRLSENKFYVDELYQMVIIRPLAMIAAFVTQIIDGRVINGIANSLGASVRWGGQAMSVLQVGNLQTYVWYLAAGTGAAIIFAVMVLSR
ncbi:MAG: NADH-quinone oxidoreductase subunit L [Bdellovibrionales bacterium]|nr:NADH-quinone oxidoreductase subunit L [Bdellovibrionales bacterium]